MKAYVVFIILISLSLLFLASFSGYFFLVKPNESGFNVSKIIDGDTFEIENGQKVRMLGINSPEKNEFYYHESAEKLAQLIKGRQVKLEAGPEDVDKYGRLLRYVFVDGKFVNVELIKGGYAVVHILNPDEKHFLEFKKAEKEAKERGLGIWKKSSDKCIQVLEMAYNAPGNDNENLNGEYAIFGNKCNNSIDMTGWSVRDRSAGNAYTFQQFSLKSGSNATLFSGKGQDSKNELYWNNRYAVWNNDGDTLFLRDRNGNLIATYSYPN